MTASVAAYDDHAGAYAAWADDVSMSVYLDDFVAGLDAGSVVLDAGCGSGRDLIDFASAGVEAIGCDLSVGLLSHVAGVVVQSDLRALPFGDASFGGVWSCASVVHLDIAGVACVLDEFGRVLAERGSLYIMVKAGDDTEGWSDTEFGTRWFRWWRLATIVGLVESCGFEVLASGDAGPGWWRVHAMVGSGVDHAG